jgi:predicted nucleotide-binding protein
MTASQELNSIATKLDDVANLTNSPELKEPIANFRRQLQSIHASHGEGSLYYEDFEIPPYRDGPRKYLPDRDPDYGERPYEIKPGWQNRTFEEVKLRVYSNLGVDPNIFLSGLAKAAKEVKFARDEWESIFDAVALRAPLSEYETSLKTKIYTTKAKDADAWDRVQRNRQPPHIALQALIEPQINEFELCADLAELCRRAARHFERSRPSEAVATSVISSGSQSGKYVFIGHGRSLLWRELKDFLQDRLRLPWDEFNREPVAGYSTTERLSAMLNDATFALMVMTAEDETAEGKWQARMNVIHEVGLFQGKLGFKRAIVLLESGCEEFSNIRGLTHIMFEKGRISSAFEETRKVLEREKLINRGAS